MFIITVYAFLADRQILESLNLTILNKKFVLYKNKVFEKRYTPTECDDIK